jgi:hypothetical protein
MKRKMPPPKPRPNTVQIPAKPRPNPRKELTPSQKRAKTAQSYDMRLIAKPTKPRKLTTAQQVQHLHDRITMLAGRLERRTPGGVEAQLALAARELQRRTDDLMVAADVFTQRLDRLAGELHSLRLRVEGIYPLLAKLLPPESPQMPARPNGEPDRA